MPHEYPLDPEFGVSPDAAIPDLVRRLTDDSKRLAANEVRLAKLEVADRVRLGGQGAMHLGIAFGAAVVALTALTICLIAAIAAVTHGALWIGATVTGVLEMVVGYLLVTRGARTLASHSYSLPETRESLKDTQTWARPSRVD